MPCTLNMFVHNRTKPVFCIVDVFLNHIFYINCTKGFKLSFDLYKLEMLYFNLYIPSNVEIEVQHFKFIQWIIRCKDYALTWQPEDELP